MSLYNIVNIAFSVYWWALIARIILSWVSVRPKNDALRSLIRLIYDITDPYLKIFRRILPIADIGGVGIDFSPILAFIVFGVARNLVLAALLEIGL